VTNYASSLPHPTWAPLNPNPDTCQSSSSFHDDQTNPALCASLDGKWQHALNIRPFQLDAKGKREGMERGLGRAIDRSRRERDKGKARGDIHDGAIGLLPQVGQERFHHPNGPLQVDVYFLCEVLGRIVFHVQIDRPHDSRLAICRNSPVPRYLRPLL
jgi:hypothetical protein